MRGKRARLPKRCYKEEAEPSDWLDLTGESDEETPTIQRKRAKQSRAAGKPKNPAQQRVDWQASIAGLWRTALAVSGSAGPAKACQTSGRTVFLSQEFVSLHAGQECALRCHALKAGTGEDGQD